MRKHNTQELDYSYNKTQNCMKENLTELSGDMDEATIIVVDFNISLSESNKLDQKY